MSATCPCFHAARPLQLPRDARGTVFTSHTQPASGTGHGFMTNHVRQGCDRYTSGLSSASPYMNVKTHILFNRVQFALLATDKTFSHLLKVLRDHSHLVQTLITSVFNSRLHHIMSSRSRRTKTCSLRESSHTFPTFFLWVCGRKTEYRTVITILNGKCILIIAEHKCSSRPKRENADQWNIPWGIKIWFTSLQSTSSILKDKDVSMQRKEEGSTQSKRRHEMKTSGQLHSPATQQILNFVLVTTSPTPSVN